MLQPSATHLSKTLQHTATHCNTLQTYCNTLKKTWPFTFFLDPGSTQTATHCNTLQHSATLCNTLKQLATSVLNILQHSATHCNTLQHTQETCRFRISSYHAYILKRAQYILSLSRNSPVSPQKSRIRVEESCVYPQNSPNMCKGALYIRKRALIRANEPYMSAKEP